MKRFLKTLLLMVCRFPVIICLWCLSAKGELLHLHGRLSGFVINKSKSRSLTNFFEIEKLSTYGCSQSASYHWHMNLTNDVGSDLTFSGSCKI